MSQAKNKNNNDLAREALTPNELVDCVARALMCAVQDPGPPDDTYMGVPGFGEMAMNGLAGEVQSAANMFQQQRPAPGIFDSSSVPRIPIDKYLHRLKAVFHCSDAAFVLALIIVDRLLMEGIRTRQEPQRLTPWNVHRLFFASLIVTVKYNEDLVYGNSHYAKAGGMHLREVNRLERFFLTRLDYKMHVQPEQFSAYEGTLRKLSAGYPLQHIPHAFGFITERAAAPMSSLQHFGEYNDCGAAPMTSLQHFGEYDDCGVGMMDGSAMYAQQVSAVVHCY